MERKYKISFVEYHKSLVAFSMQVTNQLDEEKKNHEKIIRLNEELTRLNRKKEALSQKRQCLIENAHKFKLSKLIFFLLSY